MKIGHQCFLKTAETLNMHKTAEQLYLSQQAVSAHITRLEKEYNTLLFSRKPHLQLTPAGEALLKALTEISIIEKNLHNTIKSAEANEVKSIRIGMPRYRASIVLQESLPLFFDSFPQVCIDTVYADTKESEKLLLKGEIDLALGINASKHEDILATFINKEQNFLVVSKDLLNQYYENSELQTFEDDGISLDALSKLPFIFTSAGSSLMLFLRTYLQAKQLQLRTILSVTDAIVQIKMAKLNYGAFICSDFIIGSNVFVEMNKDKSLLVIPILDFPLTNTVEIIHHRHLYMSL